MVGGETPAVATAMPILELMGKTIVHQGPAGSGQHTKMVNQILIAGGMLGMCEGLHYAEAAGLDGERVIESVGGGAASAGAAAAAGADGVMCVSLRLLLLLADPPSPSRAPPTLPLGRVASLCVYAEASSCVRWHMFVI